MDLIGKYVHFSDPDEELSVLGRVESERDGILYLTREMEDGSDLPPTRFMLSLSALALDPFNVCIFNSKADVEIYFMQAEGESTPEAAPVSAGQAALKLKGTRH